MLILYILILATAIYGIGHRNEPSSEEALSLEQSTMIKGLFVLLVFASHLGQYLDLRDTSDFLTRWYQIIRTDLGQLVVVPFLFYSGYGLRCSIEKKGKPYLRSFPRKRILRVYLHSVLIVLVFLLLQTLLGLRYSVQNIIQGFLFWGSFGNSNWYVFAILLLYLFTWLSFSFFSRKWAALFSSFLLTAAYCFALSRLAQSWWYDTVFVFWFGLIYPDFSSLLHRVIRGSRFAWLGAILFANLVVFWLTRRSYQLQIGIRGNIRAIFAMIVINLLLERFSIGNRVLQWLGSHVFECYLLQRIPMILLTHFGIQKISIVLFILGSVAGTVALTILFHKLLRRFDAAVFRT